MNTLPFLTRSHMSPNLAITIFASFRVYVHTSIPKQLPPSPLPLFTASLASLLQLYHNLPKSQITRLQQIQNSLARSVVKAPKSSHIYPVLRSLHWLKITEHKTSSCHLPAKFSPPPNHICITSSQFNFLAALALQLWSRSAIHIIFCTNSRSFLPVCFPSSLESTLGFSPSTTRIVGLH